MKYKIEDAIPDGVLVRIDGSKHFDTIEEATTFINRIDPIISADCKEFKTTLKTKAYLSRNYNTK